MSIYSHITELEHENRQKHRRRAFIAAIVALLLFIVFLVFPFFTTYYPFPEAEGVAIALGDVQMAGSTEQQTSVPQQEVPETQETEVEEEIVTIENEETPSIKQTEKPAETPKTQPQTPQEGGSPNKVDPNKLFPGGGGSSSNQSSSQNAGSPFGEEGGSPTGTGFGDEGDGSGAIGNRQPKQRCNLGWDGAGNPGVAYVWICVNPSGEVTSAEYRTKGPRGNISSANSAKQQRLAEQCAQSYRYPTANVNRDYCGYIPIYFKFE